MAMDFTISAQLYFYIYVFKYIYNIYLICCDENLDFVSNLNLNYISKLFRFKLYI